MRCPLCISFGPGPDDHVCSYLCTIARPTTNDEESARIQAESQTKINNAFAAFIEPMLARSDEKCEQMGRDIERGMRLTANDEE